LINTYIDKDNSYILKKKLLDIWASFYEIPYFPTYNEIATYVNNNPNQTNYIQLYDPAKKKCLFFNTHVYKARLSLIIIPFLYNASEYGKIIDKKIYTHVTGLGTGVWGDIIKPGFSYQPDEQSGYTSFKNMLFTLQTQCYINCLKNNKKLWDTIADIDFNYWGNFSLENIMNLFRVSGAFKKVEINESFFSRWINKLCRLFNYQATNSSFTIYLDDNSKLTIHISTRNPFETLSKYDSDKEIVATYAWDSNAFPGNEYYLGYNTVSADPAAACCSTIADSGNPRINPEGLKNIIVYLGKIFSSF
jgi:hypothetical protein